MVLRSVYDAAAMSRKALEKSWTSGIPPGVINSDWMRDTIRDYAQEQIRRLEKWQQYFHLYSAHPGDSHVGCALCYPPRSWWQRQRQRLDPWLPRIHLGPCDHEDCS